MKVPVSERIAEMNWAERMKRLEKSGRLLSREKVAQRLKVRDPASILAMQQIEHSEAAEERQRASAMKSQEEGKGGLAKMGLKLAGLGALTPLVFKKLGDAMEKLTTRILERQRDLARYSPRIATTFAKVDYQERLLASRRARGTGASTQALGESLIELRREIEPMRVMMTTIVNYAGVALAKVGVISANMLQAIKPLEDLAAWLAGKEEKGEAGDPAVFTQFVRGIIAGNVGVPKKEWKDKGIQPRPKLDKGD